MATFEKYSWIDNPRDNWSSELRKEIYGHILRTGVAGLTDEEVSIQLNVRSDSARPRRNELVKLGLIVKADFRRKTERGRTASVWISKKAADSKTKTGKKNSFHNG